MQHPLVRAISCVKVARSSRLVNVYIPTRSFSTDEDGGRREQPPRKRTGKWVRPRQCIIDTDHPSHTEKANVLKSLDSHFRLKKYSWYTNKFLTRVSYPSKRDEAIVILATPAFARWLEDDITFLPELLNIIVHQRQYSKDPNPPEIDVVCACVDGLPPRLDWIQSRDARYHREGLAFLHGPTTQILPGLWDAGAEIETSQAREDSEVSSSLTFSSPVQDIDTTPRQLVQVTLPLANTLFVTGKPSTVSVSRWRFLRDTRTYKKVQSTTKSNQVINAFGKKRNESPISHIPAIPLTPPRRVMSGLGNIIRELSFDEVNAGPASRELEVTIKEYQRAMGQEDSRVAVWALITPSKSMPYPPHDEVLNSWADMDAVKGFWQKGTTDNSFIGAWLVRGATLCSILSGGGGWGPSHGLLSLDPEVTLGAAAAAPFPFPGLGEPGEQQQNWSLEGIVKPDSYVQFFLIPEQKEVQPSEVIKAQEDSEIGACYSFTAIGSVPRPLDQIQAPALVASKETTHTDSVYFRAGQFGAVSESGLFRNSTIIKDDLDTKNSKTTLVKSKINAPFSYFYRQHDRDRTSKLIRRCTYNPVTRPVPSGVRIRRLVSGH